MAVFRNVSDDTLFLDAGDGRLQQAAPGETVTVPDDSGLYMQVGEYGETPLWEAETTAPKRSKSTGKGE